MLAYCHCQRRIDKGRRILTLKEGEFIQTCMKRESSYAVITMEKLLAASQTAKPTAPGTDSITYYILSCLANIEGSLY